MSVANSIKKISDYLLGIVKNTVTGYYELEIGIPTDWIYTNGGDNISLVIIGESSIGKAIRISQKNNNIILDDLINFVGLLVDKNIAIEDKKRDMEKELNEMKKNMEAKIVDFQLLISEMKVND